MWQLLVAIGHLRCGWYHLFNVSLNLNGHLCPMATVEGSMDLVSGLWLWTQCPWDLRLHTPTVGDTKTLPRVIWSTATSKILGKCGFTQKDH